MSASRKVISRGELRWSPTARPAARTPLLKPVSLAAASLLSLAGFALIAAALRAPYGLAMALLGFAGYVFLLSQALRCLPVDWEVWTGP